MPHVPIIIDGEKYPSVTDVIACISKPWKEGWQRRVGFQEADRISKESREQGSRCHALVEDYLDGKSSQPQSLKDERLFNLWLDWWETTPFEVVSKEELVISKKKKYGGTYDCVVTDGTQLLLADWKFSKNNDALRPAQLGGYSYAYNETHETKIKLGLVVRIDWLKEALIAPKILTLKKHERDFLVLRKAYKIGMGR